MISFQVPPTQCLAPLSNGESSHKMGERNTLPSSLSEQRVVRSGCGVSLGMERVEGMSQSCSRQEANVRSSNRCDRRIESNTELRYRLFAIRQRVSSGSRSAGLQSLQGRRIGNTAGIRQTTGNLG